MTLIEIGSKGQKKKREKGERIRKIFDGKGKEKPENAKGRAAWKGNSEKINGLHHQGTGTGGIAGVWQIAS